MRPPVRGVYWGRFQPPHKGHLKLIRKLQKEVDTLIVAVGSAEFKNTRRNPFDGEERVRMMKAYLKEEGIRGVEVVPVRDGRSYSEAIKNLLASCPAFDVLFTDKETIIRLIGGRVKVRRIRRTGTLTSTKIRDAIAAGRRWEHLTGRSVARIVRKVDGVRRIREAYGARSRI